MKSLFLIPILAVVSLFAVSCGSPTAGVSSGFGDKLVKLSAIGLQVAAARGDIAPGDVVTIAKGYAIITAPGSVDSKIVSLAELGLEAAVTRGAVKPGDALLIKEGLAVLKEPEKPPVTAEPMTSSK